MRPQKTLTPPQLYVVPNKVRGLCIFQTHNTLVLNVTTSIKHYHLIVILCLDTLFSPKWLLGSRFSELRIGDLGFNCLEFGGVCLYALFSHCFWRCLESRVEVWDLGPGFYSLGMIGMIGFRMRCRTGPLPEPFRNTRVTHWPMIHNVFRVPRAKRGVWPTLMIMKVPNTS